MNKIAAACGVSKANLYHYYKDKDALLFDVIRFHLDHLLQVVRDADQPTLAPQARLRELAATLLEAYRDADAQHHVQINSLRFLSAERQSELKGMERELVRIFSDAVAGVAPQLRDAPLLKPVTMSLFGMLNWHYLWFKEGGAVTRADYAELAARLITEGTSGLAAASGAGGETHGGATVMTILTARPGMLEIETAFSASLRATRSNPGAPCTEPLDCFVGFASSQ